MNTSTNVSERSYEEITPLDLERLGLLAAEDRGEFFSRNPRWRQLYADRILCVALCQGAALHYVNRTNGIKDIDVYTFYAEHPSAAFPYRRRGTKDFGNSKFGRHPQDVGYQGRRVDLLARSIPAQPRSDPVEALRKYLRLGHTSTSRLLAEKAIVIIEPAALRGKAVWPL